MRAPFREAAERPTDAGNPPAPDASAKGVQPSDVLGTAVLPRNFTVTTEERIRGLVQGLPAYVRRRRRIEDLEDELVRALAELDAGDAPDPERLRAQIDARLERLRRLVDAHNRYYPIEANLPMDVRTGRLMDRGEPWQPLTPATLEALRARR